MIATHRLIVRLRRHPSSALLAAQLLGVLLYPLLQDSASGQIALAVFGLVVLGLALRMVRRSPAATQSALALAVCVVVFSVWNALAPDRRLLLAVSLLEAAFYFYAAGALIRYMLQDDVATTDELVAAGATFTVLAWAWAHLYMAARCWRPAASSPPCGPMRRAAGSSCCSSVSRRCPAWVWATWCPSSRWRARWSCWKSLPA